MRTIKTEDEYVSYGAEVVARQYEPNPVMVDATDIMEHIEPIDWNKEYLEIIKVDNTEFVKLIKYNE